MSIVLRTINLSTKESDYINALRKRHSDHIDISSISGFEFSTVNYISAEKSEQIRDFLTLLLAECGFNDDDLNENGRMLEDLIDSFFIAD